ncbi:hypothetical protein [Rhizobium laguerreae]|uniref:hypothetical protein n=1 Tax=Rhizobium laguerreae TaxID=1076926 RepID=UPI001C905552|nr:hypothetical protein [Rhizobium laguerreae]MBY3078446.1 hypothetical protein [Rhizobium laguerreae]MBY3110111.1 hypothetical protein [Rhizobium laguerreae]
MEDASVNQPKLSRLKRLSNFLSEISVVATTVGSLIGLATAALVLVPPLREAARCTFVECELLKKRQSVLDESNNYSSLKEFKKAIALSSDAELKKDLRLRARLFIADEIKFDAFAWTNQQLNEEAKHQHLHNFIYRSDFEWYDAIANVIRWRLHRYDYMTDDEDSKTSSKYNVYINVEEVSSITLEEDRPLVRMNLTCISEKLCFAYTLIEGTGEGPGDITETDMFRTADDIENSGLRELVDDVQRLVDIGR